MDSVVMLAFECVYKYLCISFTSLCSLLMTQLPLSIFIVPLIILLIFMAIPLLAMRNKKP